MNAGQALGLLAGLGALNAIRGGREGTGKRFTGLMDMLDGGGAGASGDRFEGGGLLSMLGNLFMKPIEAQDNVERIARETTERSVLRPKLRPEGLLSEAQKEQIVMNQIVNPDVYGIGQGGEFAGSMLAPRATTAQSAAMEDAYSTTAPLSAPVTSDPRNFAPNTQPSMLTDAQKEAMVMGQSVVPMGNVDVRFGPRGEPTSLLDTRQQAPSPDEARALRAIAENNMMDQYINLPPYQQRAMIEAMLQRGY